MYKRDYLLNTFVLTLDCDTVRLILSHDQNRYKMNISTFFILRSNYFLFFCNIFLILLFQEDEKR